jgi:hypothetical protein
VRRDTDGSRHQPPDQGADQTADQTAEAEPGVQRGQERPAPARLHLHTQAVGRHVHRAGRGAEEQQRHAELGHRRRHAGQRHRDADQRRGHHADPAGPSRALSAPVSCMQARAPRDMKRTATPQSAVRRTHLGAHVGDTGGPGAEDEAVHREQDGDGHPQSLQRGRKDRGGRRRRAATGGRADTVEHRQGHAGITSRGGVRDSAATSGRTRSPSQDGSTRDQARPRAPSATVRARVACASSQPTTPREISGRSA